VLAAFATLIFTADTGCKSPRFGKFAASQETPRDADSSVAVASVASPDTIATASEKPIDGTAIGQTPGEQATIETLARSPFHLASHIESQFDPGATQDANVPSTDDAKDLKATVEQSTDQAAMPQANAELPQEELPAPVPDGAPVSDAGQSQAEQNEAGQKQAAPNSADANTVSGDTVGPQELLTFEDVIISTTESFPAIREASMLRTIAIGQQISAFGEFDDKLEGSTISQPLGFYENYRHDLGWKKPLIMGGTSYLGYRIGDGDFEPWYGERETDEGGEIKAGLDIPLLQNRAIDARRTSIRLASLDIQRASPELFQQVLTSQYEAASAYWTWVAASKNYEINSELMRLAEVRVDQIQKQIDAGDVARIVGIDNRRLLASRRAKLIESRQKLDSSAIKLSLYFRDGLGRPVLPAKNAKPADFPPLPTSPLDVDAEIRRAVVNRPELDILGIIEQQTRAELRLAINQRLPEISFGTEVSQDVGGLTSSKGDKQPFKLEAGLMGSVPVQRRKAIGKAQSLRGKLAQIDAKRQLTTEKIANDVRQAATVYEAALLRLEQAKLTKELALQTLNAGEIAFRAGDIDILLLNIYEQAFADAGVDVINAQADLFTAEALLSTATGTSLLDDF
jgi:outer membrane protein TolC